MGQGHRFEEGARRIGAIALLFVGLTGCLNSVEPAPLEIARTYGDDEPVTFENLYERERFWPYQIELVGDWKPPGWQGSFGWGYGVVLRVRENGDLRIDFSTHGKHWVPAPATDVVERANQLRLRADSKFKPNLALAFTKKMLDPSDTTLRSSKRKLEEYRHIVIVFADPLEDRFSRLTDELRGLEDAPETAIVLVPLGSHHDRPVFEATYHAEWPGEFLKEQFAPAYAEGLVEDPEDLPAVQIATPEGRLLYQTSWSRGVARRLRRVIESG